MPYPEDAACLGKPRTWFFPTANDAELADNDPLWRSGRATCFGCVVRTECWEANREEPHGMWAATTPRQRGFVGRQVRKSHTGRCVDCGERCAKGATRCRACWQRDEPSRRCYDCGVNIGHRGPGSFRCERCQYLAERRARTSPPGRPEKNLALGAGPA